LVASGHSRQPSGTAIDGGDYYKLLDVPYTATFKERAKQLNRAFMTLSSAETRRAYDAEIKASTIQDQIMGRYAGGLGMPGAGGDLNGESLRRTRTKDERADQRRADRSAVASMLIVFAGITLFVIALLVLWTLTEALFGSVF
jgi:hypothetical protein